MRHYFEYFSDGQVPNAPVTVCVPVYNGELYLQECLKSIALQTHRDLLAIIVDNCSTDGTAAICLAFDDGRFYYVRNDTNLGACGNHNRCLDLAQTKYVKLLSADDVLLPETLELQVSALERNPDVGLATCNCIVTNESLTPCAETLYLPGYQTGTNVVARCASYVQNLIGGPSNTLLRRAVVGNYRFDTQRKWLADLIFHCQILQHSNYINIDKVGFFYRRHSATDSEVGCSLDIRLHDEIYFVQLYGSLLGYVRVFYHWFRFYFAQIKARLSCLFS